MGSFKKKAATWPNCRWRILIPEGTHEFLALEPGLTRLGLAYLIYRFAMPLHHPFRGVPHPVGIARFLNLTGFSRPGVYRACRSLALIALILFVSGMSQTVALSFLTLFHLIFGTIRNSQGFIDHSFQALSLVLVAYTACSIWFPQAPGISLLWARQIVISVYFTAGLTKLIRSGLLWIKTSPLLALHMVKSSRQVAHDHAFHCRDSKKHAEWILAHPGLFRLLMSLGLLLELASPAILLNRTTELVGGCLLLSFHLTLRKFMALDFSCLKWLMLLFVMNLPRMVLSAL